METTKSFESTTQLLYPIYLDCNGSNPVDPRIASKMAQNLSSYLGNASASHALAKEAQAALAAAKKVFEGELILSPEDELIYTSGASESNNLAIFGLIEYAKRHNKKHIICSAIEHMSVLAPLSQLLDDGFELSVIPVGPDGCIEPQEFISALRSDTLLISCMQVDNVGGIAQPVQQLAQALEDSGHSCFLHCDASQGLAHIGPDLHPESSICHSRIDMISLSAHKMYGITGVGALLLRKRRQASRGGEAQVSVTEAIKALIHGGQQQSFRSGSIPLALILSLADAWERAQRERAERAERNREFSKAFCHLLAPLDAQFYGAESSRLSHVALCHFPGLSADDAILNSMQLASFSRGSACSSNSNAKRIRAKLEPSFVKRAGSLERHPQSLRFSWYHKSPRFWESEEGLKWADKWQRKMASLQLR